MTTKIVAPTKDRQRAYINDKRLRAKAALFHALADETRLQMLTLFVENGEMNVSAISVALDQSQPAVSHHLTQLKRAGLIDFRRAGKFNFYRLDHEGTTAVFDDIMDAGQTKLSIGSLEIHVKKRS